MKKYILSFLFMSTAIFAQDNSKFKIPQLVDTINKKNRIIKELKTTISELRNQVELLNKKEDSNNIEKFKSIIKDDNDFWLKDLFEKKYTINYFTETDIESEDITQKIIKSNVYINSIKSVEENKEIIEKCNRALEFNENYLKLFAIRRDVLNQKYDSEKVTQALKEIDNLPALENNSKLFFTKTRIRNYLENYLQYTCELKIKLDNLSKGIDQKSIAFKQLYSMLQNNERFKSYPYLIQVIEKVKNNVNNYSRNDLQPCEEVEIKNKY